MPVLNLDLLTVGIAVAAILILGFIVFFAKRDSITGKLFLLFTLVSAMWGVFNYISYKAADPVIGSLTVRLVMFLATYQAGLFFLLTYIFPQDNFVFPKRIKYVFVPMLVIVSLLTFTRFMYSDVIIKPGGTPQPVPAPGLGLFAIIAISSVIAGIVTLIMRIIKTQGKMRQQFIFLLVGVLFMFGSIILFNFIFTAFLNNSSFVPLSGIFILPFVFFTFYAIVRHKLLDIKIIGTEIVTLFLIIISFAEVVLSSTFSEIVFRSGVFVALLIVGILLIRSVMREVSQREKLAELTEKLQALDKQKDEFISMAAHELRSPLTAIKGYVSMILEGDTGDIPEKARGYLADVNSINERLIRLVNNMLNVSRIEEGRMVYQLEKEHLSRITRAVHGLFVPEAQRKELELSMSILPKIKDMVYVDVDKVHEIMANLLSNAIKYTDKGRVTMALTNPNSKTVRFEVVDTGTGISKEEQEKLFQKFYRVESNVGKTTGTGLGLYICKLLVEKFNGKIGVDSESGKGSTFWFELPIYNEGDSMVSSK